MKLVKLEYSGKTAQACDISYWQGQIDFKKMYAAGIRIVIIRAGYGTTQDKNFVSYINGALAAGIAVGVYWFMYALNAHGAVANARKCAEVILPYKGQITCGVWADWEGDSDRKAGKLTPAQRSAMVNAFLGVLETDYEVGIYSNQDYIKSGKFTKSLIADYPLWFAKYSLAIGQYADKGKDKAAYMWQYTSSAYGNMYGVSSATIDLDRVYFRPVYPTVKETVLDKVQKDNTVIKASDNPYPKPTRIIYYKPGMYIMRGDDIKHVQWHLWRFGLFLNEHGIPDATKIDGKWGSDSQTAFEEAQRRLGLEMDGKCGSISIEKFNNV